MRHIIVRARVGVLRLAGAGALTLGPVCAGSAWAQAPVGSVSDVVALNDEADAGPAIDAYAFARTRFDADLDAMRSFRPGYTFWRNIFTIPDGSIAFGSAEDGRLVAVFPGRGDWTSAGEWREPSLASVLEGARLPSRISQRRDEVASLLEPQVGRIVHNATRGDFLLPNLERYGGFAAEWGAIYERFGVPAEVGLAQAILESGFDGRIRSEARALGFCQWMPRNWERMKRLAHQVLEGYNQTTQAPYCAAYLTILATKYGSFIPALSEHHAGGTNVARVVITGERMGGTDVRERYLLGSQLVRDLRDIAPRTYRDVYGTYGPRSHLYAEMVFGNASTVHDVTTSVPQQEIFAMRAPRAIPISEVTRRTGLSADEVKRFNPALVNRVPAGANLYLPTYVADFGQDVAFWHRSPSPEYLAVLDDFLRLDATVEEWNEADFRSVLGEYQRRFEETGSEEGRIMATTIAYAIEEMYSGNRPRIVREYANDRRIHSLVERGMRERERALAAEAAGR